MIIWSGWGWLVAVIAFGCLVLTELVVEGVTKDESYYQAHGWPKLLAFWIAAVLVFILARFSARSPGKTVIDKDTGKEIVLGKNHALFFIPIRFWPIVLGVLGAVFFFVKE